MTPPSEGSFLQPHDLTVEIVTAVVALAVESLINGQQLLKIPGGTRGVGVRQCNGLARIDDTSEIDRCQFPEVVTVLDSATIDANVTASLGCFVC